MIGGWNGIVQGESWGRRSLGEGEAIGRKHGDLAGGDELAEVVREKSGVARRESSVIGLDVAGDGGLCGAPLLRQLPQRHANHLMFQGPHQEHKRCGTKKEEEVMVGREIDTIPRRREGGRGWVVLALGRQHWRDGEGSLRLLLFLPPLL